MAAAGSGGFFSVLDRIRGVVWSEFWTAVGAVGGVVGCVSGLVALFQTRKANKLAEDANRIAKEANRISTDSRDAASSANELAAKANEIGEHANLIAQRALASGLDQTVYRWSVEYDASDSVLLVRNDCGLEARDVSVLVRCEGETVADGFREALPGLGEFKLDATLMLEKLREDASRYGNGFYGSPRVRVSIGVVWTSELGNRRSLECEQGFGYVKRRRVLG